MLGPDYQKPEPINETEQWHELSQQLDTSHSIAELNWREFYTEPELQALIETALKNNIDLLVSAERVFYSQQEVTQADAQLLPRIDLRLSSEKEGESGYLVSDPGIKNSSEFHGLLSWEIDLWGQLRRASQSATAEWQASYVQMYGAQVSLISQVARIYYDIQNIKKQIIITKKTISDRLHSLKTNKLRKKQGRISGLDVSQSKVEWLTEKIKLPGFNKTLKELKYKLALIMAEKPRDFSIPVHEKMNEYMHGIPAGLPSDLLTRRPDIIAAERYLEVASAQIGVAEANFFPNIILTSELGRKSNDLDDVLSSRGENWLIEFNILTPLLDWGFNKATLNKAESEFRQAALNYKNTVLSALKESADAFDNFEKAQEIFKLRKMLLSSTRNNLRIAELTYENGIITYLDVLDAQRNHSSAQQDLSNAVNDMQDAVVTLYTSLGGGWDASILNQKIKKPEGG